MMAEIVKSEYIHTLETCLNALSLELLNSFPDARFASFGLERSHRIQFIKVMGFHLFDGYFKHLDLLL